jgi:hypothetical protein
VAIPLPWTEGDEDIMEEPENKNISPEGTKLLSKAIAGNYKEPKVKPAKRLNRNQAKEDSKGTDLDQIVLNSSSSSETSKQDISEVEALDIDVDDQTKGIDKKTLKCDNEDLFKGFCKKKTWIKSNRMAGFQVMEPPIDP